MVNYNLRLFNIHDPKVEKIFEDPEFKNSQGFAFAEEYMGFEAELVRY